ncbi:hypothetical protein MKK70_22965 [Methylobacterium sp. E-041]|uniref:hypothetical protein n=1 Tax=Methylobacterium sp. E-041 TaxID=2836573 RepID=UPI001FBC024F|nr:hypothetical protein [Methylobacterium sp. E-041]MCJ2108176.1 hypothetical protein [Methylobacterium sp. E-041]
MSDRVKSDTVQLKLRLKEPDRSALEKSAQERGVSLNTEIVDRLRRSFDEERSISDLFGNRRDFAFMKFVYATIENIVNLKKPDADWREDPYRFDQIFKAVVAIFEAIRPKGKLPNDPEEALDYGGQHRGVGAAYMALQEIMQADPNISFGESGHRLRTSILANDLGKLAQDARLPTKSINSISEELLPYVEQAMVENVSVLDIYHRSRSGAEGGKSSPKNRNNQK